jgi:DNA-binding NarL/FixJ family response regulator
MEKVTPPPAKIRVLLVDDHVTIRMGVTTAASDAADMEVIAEAECGEDAIAIFREHRPDLVVLDLRMQGMGGIETLKALREEFKTAKVLIFCSHAKGEEIYQAMRMGAAGFVLKEMPLDRLLDGIRAVNRGEQYIPREIAVRMGERLLAHISPREMDVLRLLGRGLSNKEIGGQLGVVEGTVKLHIASIFTKLGVSDRTQALVEAIKRGIVQVE